MRVLTSCLLLAVVAACATGDDYQAAAAERAALAAAPPGRGDAGFTPVPPAQPLPRVRLEYGEGGCEPRYSDGTRGTCINGKPCNGFGFRGARGELVCACFEAAGGCPDTQACSSRRRACVARGALDVQRLPPP